MDKITINVPSLTRVEGEGALRLTISDQKITELHLSIYEPPRLFEQGIIGRHFEDVPDMVARICGICPVAYQMSAVQALESIFNIEVTEWSQRMRRLYYCGEWIESHALHIHLLALPDFLGFNSVVDMAGHFPNQVNRGLQLQHFGNQLIALLGGRSVNPVGARVGGFHGVPDKSQVDKLREQIDERIEQAIELLLWLNELDYPKLEQPFLYASLYNGHDYPMCHGNVRVSDGNDIPLNQFADYFQEHQVDYSTALHCLYQKQPYLVGPLARLNNNYEFLTDSLKVYIDQMQLRIPSHNTFDSILARAIEIVYSLQQAKTLLDLTESTQAYVPATPRAGVGYGCTEAPRGMLWHRYETNAEGQILGCAIVPPTSQNQARIEADIKQTLEQSGFEQEQDRIRLLAEQVIRNYDPCISCATHFLNLELIKN